MKDTSRVVFMLGLFLAFTAAADSFIPTGSMATARYRHTATLLLDGRVLIAGGDGSGSTPSGRGAELYDPATGRFVATGSLVQPRGNHSATLLPNGKVLIVGGWFQDTAELYDPSTGTFSLAGNMLAPQGWHMATLLANGKVLIAGNVSAQLYDPARQQFLPAGAYAGKGRGNTATLLADGRVLLVGDDPAQLYDPVSDTFSFTGSLGSVTELYGLEFQSATLLRNGKVLIAGGRNEDAGPRGLVIFAELYDPATGRFSATSAMHAPRAEHGAILLPDGKVLVIGGESLTCMSFECGHKAASTELYDPLSGKFAAGANMNVPRAPVTATPLKNGDVLITGGPDASAELYRPSASTPSDPSYQALWWNSPAGSEPGWGLNITHQGDILFATWLTYDTDGSAMWLVMPRGELVTSFDPPTYSGLLYRTTGPAFDAPTFDSSAVTATAVGRATFTFTDFDNGSFLYDLDGVVRAKPITRFVFSSMPTCVRGGTPGVSPNFQDLWWKSPAGSESGWGVNLTHQGDILFATWSTYDTNGRSLWLVMPRGDKVDTNVFTGPLYRTSGPAFSNSTWDATRVVATSVGTATFAFTGANSGTFTATVNGATQSKPITRLVYSNPTTVCY